MVAAGAIAVGAAAPAFATNNIHWFIHNDGEYAQRFSPYVTGKATGERTTNAPVCRLGSPSRIVTYFEPGYNDEDGFPTCAYLLGNFGRAEHHIGERTVEVDGRDYVVKDLWSAAISPPVGPVEVRHMPGHFSDDLYIPMNLSDKTSGIDVVSGKWVSFYEVHWRLKTPAQLQVPKNVKRLQSVGSPAGSAADCTIVGTPEDDVLVGTDGDDVICGLGGDDRIDGLGGDDIIRGGDGDDVIDGGAGDDVIGGGAGGDSISGGPGDDDLYGGLGDDAVDGGTGSDVVIGGTGDDRLGTGDAKDAVTTRSSDSPSVAVADVFGVSVAEDSDGDPEWWTSGSEAR